MSRFAFGIDEYEGFKCPARAALGKGPGCVIGREYDTSMRERTGNREGVVSEEDAKEVWLETIEKMKEARDSDADRLEHPNGVSTPVKHTPWSSYIEAAEEIAEELGWI